VRVVVDTTALSEGKHYILVHGKNDDGVWGPYTAVFLEITFWHTIFLPVTTK